MNLPAKMSWRYLFARKSTNAVNVITLVAAFGVAVGTTALILVLSVFNGFEDLFLENFNDLNPDVRITPARGKTFPATDDLVRRIARVEGVDVVARSLEETAIFSYNDKQSPGRIKGVDRNFPLINGLDSLVYDGRYTLFDTTQRRKTVLVGDQMALLLGIDPHNEFEALTVYMARPKPRGGGNPLLSGRSSHIRRDFQPTGVIRSQEEREQQGALIELEQARRLLSMSGEEVSSLEVKLLPDFIHDDTYAAIRRVVGNDYVVANRFEQENSILKLMRIEKWVGFAVVILMMILVSFNLVGALYMIVLEKRRDIAILRSLGMTRATVRGVFVRVGLLLTSLGIAAGFLIAIVVYVLQKTYGLVPLPNTLGEAYPISFRPLEFVWVALTVLAVSTLASYLPAHRAGKVDAVLVE